MEHRPTLYIGIGGSGCKTLSLIKRNFTERYGYGKIPGHIRFFCIDTDICLDEALKDDTYIIGQEDSSPQEYLDYNIRTQTGLCDWYIDNCHLYDPIACGTEASRADARLAMEVSQKNILAQIRLIISELLDAAHNSGSVDIDVRFVMSLAGGTGSGIFIPLAMLVSQFEAVNLYGYAILHGIYIKSDPGGPVFQRAFANSYASVLELDYLQHASEDNQIKMSVGGIDCILKAPLFKGFYMVEHLNNAGKIIQNVQDMYNVLALSMFSSSFEGATDMVPENSGSIYDIKDKKGWLGSIGACEIIFNGEKFADLYSLQIAYNIIHNTLRNRTEGIKHLRGFLFNGKFNMYEADFLIDSLNDHISIALPETFHLSSLHKATKIYDEVESYLTPKPKYTYIDEEFAENATLLRSYLSTIGSNPNTAHEFLTALIEHCQRISQTLAEQINSLSTLSNNNKTLIHSYIDEYSSYLSRRLHRSEYKKSIEEKTQQIAVYQHAISLREYGIDMMNALASLAEKYRVKVDEYNQALHNADSYLSYHIEHLEKHLSSSSSQFVYDTTVMYWKEFDKGETPDHFTINLLDYYLESGNGSSTMTNHLLQHIHNLPSVIYHKRIPLASVIRTMGENQFKSMIHFIRASAIRMLMLNGRGYMINDQMVIDCMTRNVVISMCSENIDALEADIEGIWKLWDNCLTNISWNNITDGSFHQRAIIAVHEGNIIPYCVDAFYPEMVQKEYTETIAKGIYNPHVDAILYERMRLSSHSLKPRQATITPQVKDATASTTKNSRKHHTREEEKPIVNVFIAGSKELRDERDLVRVELSKLSNVFNLDIRPHSFEDFKSSLKGQQGGRQADYNRFIRTKADAVIFIFDSKAGSITEEEFDVAYDSLAENKRPDIFVYGRNMSNDDPTLKKIKERIFSYGQEYYIEYTSRDDLRYQFYKDMVAYFV
ncbi:MAG: hypothetical protein IKV05_04095 [Bacteroidales bacterium]|nr:hypothetical protein [Bacteroidales bacterium]